MSESTVLDFGLSTGALIESAAEFGVIGTTAVKVSKVLALFAILQGAPTEDASKRTGISEGTLKRIRKVVLSGIPAREGVAGVSAATVSKAAHKLASDGIVSTLIDGGMSWADKYDAQLAASKFWDKFLVETKESRAPKEMTATDLAILVHDSIVAAGENAPLWAAAVQDALESAQAEIAAIAEAEAAA